MDPIADLLVSLTTSGYIHMTEDGDPNLEIELFTKDLPVCSAIHVMDIPPNLPARNLTGLSQVVLTGLKQVDINSNLRSVFVGVDKNDESTAAVQYTPVQDTPYVKAFFDRWDETHAMIFEYSIRNRYDTLIVCIQGFWAKDSWVKLGIVEKPLIEVREPEE